MTHQEKIFILYKAHLLWRLQQKAVLSNDSFVPTDRFDPISPKPLEAQVRIFMTEAGPEMILAIRRPAERAISALVLDACASHFFTGVPFKIGTRVEDDEYVTTVYVSSKVIPSIMPLTD